MTFKICGVLWPRNAKTLLLWKVTGSTSHNKQRKAQRENKILLMSISEERLNFQML